MTATQVLISVTERRAEARELARRVNDGGDVAGKALHLLAAPALTGAEVLEAFERARKAIKVADLLLSGEWHWNRRYNKEDLEGGGTCQEAAIAMAFEEAASAVDELLGI